MLTTDEAVNAVRLCDREKRTERVNRFLAGPSEVPIELQWRAWFISALREQGVWPCKP
jgi:hypothetical protein